MILFVVEDSERVVRVRYCIDGMYVVNFFVNFFNMECISIS